MILVEWLSTAYLLALVGARYFDIGSVRAHNIEAATFIFVAVVLVKVLSRRVRHDAVATSVLPSAAPPGWLGLVFFAVALVLYAPIIKSGFFADDFVLVEAARRGQFTVWTELFRPVIFVVWRAVGFLPWHLATSLHLLNIVLHALNATMVTALTLRVGLTLRASAAAGALFICFPASVEAVAWPAGIQDVLMTTFVLAFLLAMTAIRFRLVTAVCAVGLFAAACLTKETGFTGIALAALVCVKNRARRARWVVVGISTAVAAVLLMVRFAVLPSPVAMAPRISRYQFKELLVRPFATLVVPLREAEITYLPWVPVMLVAVIVAAIVVASRNWDRRNAEFHTVLFGALFVLASIGAVNTLLFVSGDLLGARYLYLGSVGWSILLATTFSQTHASRWNPRSVLLIVTVACWTAATVAHVQLWTGAAAQRDLIVGAAEKALLSGCHDSTVDGLPQVMNGVPLFLNGFPEAMRERVSTAQFHTDDGTVDIDCRLRWTGSGFRKH